MKKAFLRKRIGCCSSFGMFEIPKLGLSLVFDDDCKPHSMAEIEAITPVAVTSHEAEYWVMKTVESSFSTYQWRMNGTEIDQDVAIEVFINSL